MLICCPHVCHLLSNDFCFTRIDLPKVEIWRWWNLEKRQSSQSNRLFHLFWSVVFEFTFFPGCKQPYIIYIYIYIFNKQYIYTYFACACKLTLMMAFTIALLCLQFSPFGRMMFYINDGDYEIDGICFAHLPWSQAWTAWKDKKKTSRSKDSNGIKWSNLDEGKWTRIKGAAICSIQNLYTFLHHKPLKIWVGWCIFPPATWAGEMFLADFLCHLRLIEILGVPLGTWFVQPLLQSRFASFNLWIVKKTCWICWYENWMWQPWGIHEMYSSRLLALIVFLASMSDAHTHTCSQPCWSVICLRSSLSDICFTHLYIYIYTCYTSLGQWEAHTTCASWELAKKLSKRWPWRARSCQKAAGSRASSQG